MTTPEIQSTPIQRKVIAVLTRIQSYASKYRMVDLDASNDEMKTITEILLPVQDELFRLYEIEEKWNLRRGR